MFSRKKSFFAVIVMLGLVGLFYSLLFGTSEIIIKTEVIDDERKTSSDQYQLQSSSIRILSSTSHFHPSAFKTQSQSIETQFSFSDNLQSISPSFTTVPLPKYTPTPSTTSNSVTPQVVSSPIPTQSTSISFSTSSSIWPSFSIQFIPSTSVVIKSASLELHSSMKTSLPADIYSSPSLIPISSSSVTISATMSEMLLSDVWTNTKERRKIIMMETSGKESLNGRQSCAVESAARHNPDMDVMLFFTSPTLNLSDVHTIALSEISNVRLQYLNLNDFFIGSPLHDWYVSGKWKESPYKTSHTSDALRFLTLWRFGGFYLDLDVVVIRSLEELHNCSGRESNLWVAAGVMTFDRSHPFLKMCLDEFAKTYRGGEWGYNGPELVTRVLKRICKPNGTSVTEMSRDRCEGIAVLHPSAFYAIPWSEWTKFFDTKDATNVMKKWKDSYLIHVWNKHSSKQAIEIGSGQPYELAAKVNCPSVYKVNIAKGYF